MLKDPRQLSNRRCLEQHLDGKRSPERRMDPSAHPHRAQRVSAKLKEVVVDADMVDL
jgi:hypothetical protein